MSFNVVLFEPEIPPNTGNIIRLCANTGCQLHLIEPLGFDLNEQKLRRAGLDYQEWVHIKQYSNFSEFLSLTQPSRIFACTTKGLVNYTKIDYQPHDFFLFGPESRGLPSSIRDLIPSSQHIVIPMQTPSRSLNLSNAVAIIIYEAWRQCHFN